MNKAVFKKKKKEIPYSIYTGKQWKEHDLSGKQGSEFSKNRTQLQTVRLLLPAGALLPLDAKQSPQLHTYQACAMQGRPNSVEVMGQDSNFF